MIQIRMARRWNHQQLCEIIPEILKQKNFLSMRGDRVQLQSSRGLQARSNSTSAVSVVNTDTAGTAATHAAHGTAGTSTTNFSARSRRSSPISRVVVDFIQPFEKSAVAIEVANAM